MAPAEVLLEIAVRDPDEASRFGLLRFAPELLAHACHHAGEERAPVAIDADAMLRLVLAPEPFARRDEVAMDVLGDLDVVGCPADLEDAPALSLERAIDR